MLHNYIMGAQKKVVYRNNVQVVAKMHNKKGQNAYQC